MTRLTSLACLVCLTLLSDCAYEGTVVRKEYRLLPFRESLGVAGIYRFELRGRDGQLHQRMVSADVFSNYQVGHHFDDRQPAQLPSEASPAEGPAPEVTPLFMVTPMLRPLEEYGTHYRTMQTAWTERAAPRPNDRVAGSEKEATRLLTSVKTPHRTTHRNTVAARQHTKHQVKVARRTKHKKHPPTIVRARQSPTTDSPVTQAAL